MLFGSRNSKKKLFHYGCCRYSKRTKSKSRLRFCTVEEAHSRGYSQCPYCSRILREYRRNQEAITNFCSKHNLHTILTNDELYIISRDDTAWRICMKGDGSKSRQLLHESKRRVAYDRRTTAYEDREYHLQDIPGSSITGYLSYIHKHDISEAAREKKQEKAKVEKSLLQEQLRSIWATQKQISRQNRKRNKHAPAESHAQKRRRSKQYLRDISRSFNDYRAAQEAYI